MVRRRLFPSSTSRLWRWLLGLILFLGGVDPAAQVNTTLVDAKGRTVSVWNANNIGGGTPSISFGLDGFGRMRTTTLLGQSQVISASYDALGRQTQLVDPDKGAWTYVNSALGQVLTQNDPAGNTTDSVFDLLGRPLSRTTHGTSPTETANFYYYDTATVTTPLQHTVAKGAQGWIGAPEREECTATGSYATVNLHYYDEIGRPSLELAQTDGKWFYTYSDYDQYSRVRQVRHYWKPAGAELPSQQPYLWQDFGYIYTYDSRSYLTALTDSLGRSWWDTPSYDYMDRVTSVRKGSGLTTTRTYRDTDGVLTAMNNGVQNWSFGFDGLGNLTSRGDGTNSESFVYDNLNRVITAGNNGGVGYSDNGNIQTKTSVDAIASGTYAYDAGAYVDAFSPTSSRTLPHAVSSAFGWTFKYDLNGNLLTRDKAGDQSGVTWTGFDKPRTMWRVKGGVTTGSEFHYNAARSRVMQFEFDSMNGTFPNQTPLHYNRKRTYALGSTLELNYNNTITSDSGQNWALDTVRIYVPGPDGIIGAREFRPVAGGTEKALVYHYDHLGSITAITKHGDTSGTLATDTNSKPGKYSEDAWGQRRDPIDWIGAPDPAATDDGGFDSLTPRGFTGHEMLDDLGLVHMNGRIYDPLLGRFLSADILVQAPNNLQAYNRYSYVFNNPLSYTDPSGFKTIRDYEDEIEKEREELERERAKVEGNLWGAFKYVLNLKNWARAAAISGAKESIRSIESHAGRINEITHQEINARDYNDESPFYQLQTAGMRFGIVPFASVGGEIVAGNPKAAAKDAVLQGLFYWAFKSGSGRGGPSEAGISARIAAAAADGRRALASDFYAKSGYSEFTSHLEGINFGRPVEISVIPKGTRVIQHQYPNNPQGSYYAPEGTPVNTLGIDPSGRVTNVYVTTKDVTVLRSTAADTTGNLNVNATSRGPGGGTQYFTRDKAAFTHE